MIAFPTTITIVAEPMYLEHTFTPESLERLGTREAFEREVERLGGVSYYEGPLDTIVVQVENPAYASTTEDECRPEECDLSD